MDFETDNANSSTLKPHVKDKNKTEQNGAPEQTSSTDGAENKDGGKKFKKVEFYDEDYYDSDDDDDESDDKRKQHPVISNEDLFYDPEIDDDNQRWMDEQRARRRPKTKTKVKQLAPNSDAMLDCPACLTTLCIDCQRHDIYENQFRAMFVQNCTVDETSTITAPLQDKQRKRKHHGGHQTAPNDDDSQFQAVKCSECQTVVGAMDKEEVYHFFNVLPSHT